MTEKERLIELLEQGHKKYLFYDQIAAYLLANGVIVPPCKVGDIVYVITIKRPCYACLLCTDFRHVYCSFDDKNELVVKTARVCAIKHGETTNKMHLEIDKSKICDSYDYTCWFEDIGKTVFLTHEEAEEALERSRDEIH